MDKNLERAGKILRLTKAPLEKLAAPEHVRSARLRIRRDDGRWQNFKAWRVQHSSRRGPYKGGIRFHPAVTLGLLKSLALEMSLKTAVAGLPLGGSKGGVAVDPKQLTVQELEALGRAYVRQFFRHLGPYQDIPAPDMGTNEKVMAWMGDEFAVIGRKYELGSRNYGGKNGKLTEGEIQAAFTGKPVGEGGSEGRAEATGRGGLMVLREVLKQAVPAGKVGSSTRRVNGVNPTGFPRLTVAVQGLGNVGGVFARLASEAAGFKVVAVGDSRGGIAKVKSKKLEVKSSEAAFGKLDVEQVLKWKEEKGTLGGLPGTRTITNEELLELPVDILVPAALGNVITAANADKIRAKITLELANGPTTPEADEILRRKGVVVIPDILANAGGVIVSYFEWRQNLKDEHWSAARVNRELARVMRKAVADVLALQRRYKVDLRTAAYIKGLKGLKV